MNSYEIDQPLDLRLKALNLSRSLEHHHGIHSRPFEDSCQQIRVPFVRQGGGLIEEHAHCHPRMTTTTIGQNNCYEQSCYRENFHRQQTGNWASGIKQETKGAFILNPPYINRHHLHINPLPPPPQVVFHHNQRQQQQHHQRQHQQHHQHHHQTIDQSEKQDEQTQRQQTPSAQAQSPLSPLQLQAQGGAQSPQQPQPQEQAARTQQQQQCLSPQTIGSNPQQNHHSGLFNEHRQPLNHYQPHPLSRLHPPPSHLNQSQLMQQTQNNTSTDSAPITRQHSLVSRYNCKPCGIVFSQPETLRAHQEGYCTKRDRTQSAINQSSSPPARISEQQQKQQARMRSHSAISSQAMTDAQRTASQSAISATGSLFAPLSTVAPPTPPEPDTLSSDGSSKLFVRS